MNIKRALNSTLILRLVKTFEEPKRFPMHEVAGPVAFITRGALVGTTWWLIITLILLPRNGFTTWSPSRNFVHITLLGEGSYQTHPEIMLGPVLSLSSSQVERVVVFMARQTRCAQKPQAS